MRMCRYLAVCPPGTALSFVIGCSRRSHQSDFADFEVCKRQNGEKDSSGCKRRRTNLPILPKFQVQNCRSICSPRHKDWRAGARVSTAQELAGGMGGRCRRAGQRSQRGRANDASPNCADCSAQTRETDGALGSLALWHADGDEAPVFHHNGRSKLLQKLTLHAQARLEDG